VGGERLELEKLKKMGKKGGGGGGGGGVLWHTGIEKNA